MIRKNILSIVFLALVMSGFAQTEEVSVYNLESINSPKMEFGAVPYGDGLMYTSTNGEKFKGKIDKCNTEDYFAKLFYASRDDMDGVGALTGTVPDASASNMVDTSPGCGFKSAFPVSGDIKGKFHDGTPTVSPDGNRMVFARNYPGKSNFMNACNDNAINMRLMSAERVGDQWVNATDLPLGGEDFNTAHPAFTADGQCLYFSSDRPGGVGGMDLYKVCRSGEGWGTPTNLGSPINSAGNEVFPYAAQDGTLYYSSNGLGGEGGLDVLSSTMANGSWSSPENLGAPFNSAGDDLGFTLLADGESGYLTSNRAGGQGGDDIYCWKVNKADVKLAVEDAVSRDRIGNSLVKIKGVNDYTADGNGMAIPDITHRRCYELEVDEPGYEYWSKEVCARELASADPYIIPLVKKSYPLKGNVIWEDKEIAPDSRVVLKNLITGETKEVTANAEGIFDLPINCLDDYELIAYKNGKESARKALPASEIDCTSGANAITLVLPKPPPPPPPAPVCACTGNPNEAFNLPALPMDAQTLNRLGSRPEFGNSHNMSSAEFYNKLKTRYGSSSRDAEFLDKVFQGMGYSGFNDPSVSEYSFSETTLVPGIRGNMGYTKRHRVKYVQLNTRGKDLEAFRINAKNACHVHFMKTCGNFFFFCSN